jgi:hypothetical protein
LTTTCKNKRGSKCRDLEVNDQVSFWVAKDEHHNVK